MSPRSAHLADARRTRRSLTSIAIATGLVLGLVTPSPAHADDTTTTVVSTPTPSTPVLSFRRAPEIIRSSISETNIRNAVQPLIDDADAGSCIAVYQDGRPLIGKDVEAPKVPASLAKVLTASAVLQGLDPNSHLTTTAASANGVDDGVIDGDLYIIGGGDPLLSTPGYLATLKDPEQMANQLSGLADALANAGVREVRGALVGDDSRYSTERWVPSWPTNYRSEGDVGPLSALMVNDGFEGYTSDPDRRGTIDPGDPPLLAVQTLETLLEERGVRITGTPRVATAPEGLQTVASLDSLTVAEMVHEFIDDSDNVTGELLTRELGLQHRDDGSTPAGVSYINEVLAGNGLPLTNANLVDGSGLDPNYKVTCALMVAALDRQGRNSVIGQALPVAGVSGTLRTRMTDSPAEGNVQAKTGSLSAVSALAGFVTTAAGSDLTFAYIINTPGIFKVYRSLDTFAETLAGLDDGPPLDLLEPLPATP